jgi:hypothetical protein
MHPIIIFASFEVYLQFNGPLWKHAFSLFQLLPIPNQIILRTRASCSHMLQPHVAATERQEAEYKEVVAMRDIP